MLSIDYERVYFKAQKLCEVLTKEEFNKLCESTQEALIDLAVFCCMTHCKWWTVQSNNTADSALSRSHNCWECENAFCFNKKFPPKESNEGLDCLDWE